VLAALGAILLISIIIKIVIDHQIRKLRLENNKLLAKKAMSAEMKEALGDWATERVARKTAKVFTRDQNTYARTRYMKRHPFSSTKRRIPHPLNPFVADNHNALHILFLLDTPPPRPSSIHTHPCSSLLCASPSPLL
jgi:hypothetical protein